MHYSRNLAYYVLLLGCAACAQESAPPSQDVDSEILPDVPNLVFQSGFEQGVEHVHGLATKCSDDLIGEDLTVSERGDWELDLEGGPISGFKFCFGGGDRSQRTIDLTEDPDDSGNRVLHGQIIEPAENVADDDSIACNEPPGLAVRKARIHSIVSAERGLSRLDYRVRVRLGAGGFGALVAAAQPINWMTLGEVWNNLPAENGTFRVTLNAVKQAGVGAPLYFGLKADRQDDGIKKWIHVWPENHKASDVEVPIGEWFTLEFSIIEGDKNSGRVHVQMTDSAGERHTIADVTNWTYSPVGTPDGFSTLNPLKLYTSGDLMCALKERGHTLDIWWDDFAIGSPG